MAGLEVTNLTRNPRDVDFHHPYTPYEVQEQFMVTVYAVLEAGDGQVGILESPTGTGKSLSLICSSLVWLRNHKSSQFAAILKDASASFKDEPEWLVSQMLRRKQEEVTRQWEERETRLELARRKEKATEEAGRKRRRVDVSASTKKGHTEEEEEAEWLLQEGGNAGGTAQDALSGLSKESRETLTRIGLGRPKQADGIENVTEEKIKIFYTSRTHSQLSQFISELRRPSFPSSLPRQTTESQNTEAVKLMPLASRQMLCINPEVSRLGSVQAINDRCAELQRPNSSKKCAYMPKPDILAQTHQFRDSALATVPDIEDLYSLGKSLGVCPYYASRTALPEAEVVTLPYPLLLQKSARHALNIDLEGSVVIIDEAHNIMDAIANVYAAEIRLSDLKRARSMLSVYVKRFGKKLSGVNRVNVGRVGRLIDGLMVWMEQAIQYKSTNGTVEPNDLLRAKGVDQINLFELIQYIQESKLAFKIESYASHVENEKNPKHVPKLSSPTLHALVSFTITLTNPSSEGRLFYEKLTDNGPDMKVSYLLLSPTHAFSSILSSARAVILAGGTMSPFEDYKDHLFPTLPREKLTTLSCGHVIPPENLCVRTLASSRPDDTPFEFSYQRRGDKKMIAQLGLAILNICSVVPDGVVAFFPSYGYLAEVVNIWQASKEGGSSSIWQRLQVRKTVFQEMKGSSSDETLQAYSQAILDEGRPRNGALLLSVVGGKMSEGINFSDRLGRCVLVIGLPFPNIASADWKAKMEYIESTTIARLTGLEALEFSSDALKDVSRPGQVTMSEATSQAKQASRDFYENACMRAVNQSIGRAIRHKGDYAAIVLVDRRYDTERIKAKLPGWIREGMGERSHERSLGGLMGSLGGFFRTKKLT